MAAPPLPPSLNPCARLNALSGRTDPLLVSSLSSSDRIRTRTLYMASRQPVAQELRRAMINGVLWLEMVCLPPHAMAGSKYYASQGQAPTPIKPALFDTSVGNAAHSAASAVGGGGGGGAPKAAAAETQEHAKQRLAAATTKLQAAQDAKAASALKLAEAQKEDDLAAQELDRAAAAKKSAADAVEATKPKPKVHPVAHDDIQLCMAHGVRSATASETSWVLADIKVTKSSKAADAAAVGVIHSIKEGGRFGFILASINDRRGSVYVNLEKKPEVKQGQIVEFNVRMQGESKVQAIITKTLAEGSVRHREVKEDKPHRESAATTDAAAAPQAATAASTSRPQSAKPSAPSAGKTPRDANRAPKAP